MTTHRNFRTQEHLIDQICNRSGNAPNFAILIGAGASISSGVPSASKMIEDWRKQLYSRTQNPPEFNDWLKEQTWYKDEDEYSLLFEKVFDQPSQRRIYIENCVKDAKPSWGYIYLSNIIASGCVNVVFTPNFDDLLNEACFLYTDQKPMVCAHDSAVSDVRITSKRPKIIKLHGDYLYDSLKNTVDETTQLEQNMRDKFMQFGREYGLILIGYSGNDRSIMDVLDSMLRQSSYLPHGLYWCTREKEIPGKKLDRLLTRDRTYRVQIEGFDEFMAELHEKLKLKLPDSVGDPYRAVTNRLNTFVTTERTIHPIIKKDIAALANKIKDFESAVSTTFDKLVPYTFLGSSYFSNHDYLSAVINYQKALKQNPKDLDVLNYLSASFEYLSKFDKSLAVAEDMIKIDPKYYKGYYRKYSALLSKNQLEEAEKAIKMALPLSLSSDENQLNVLISFSNLSIITKKWADAISFADAALKLKKDEAPAILNKANALKNMGKIDDAKKLIDSILPMLKPYEKACAFALLGDKDNMLIQLSVAIRDDQAYKVFAGRDPDFAQYQQDPEFKKIVLEK
jgi:tetratricopeptide (TPR) repeat protein